MTQGQFFNNAKCPDCQTRLPVLTDNGGWGLATCPGCGRKFDTDDYRNAGGQFHTGLGCRCPSCLALEGTTID